MNLLMNHLIRLAQSSIRKSAGNRLEIEIMHSIQVFGLNFHLLVIYFELHYSI